MLPAIGAKSDGFNESNGNDGGSKSPSSSAGGDCESSGGGVSAVGGHSQPLDLSNKGSSPSVSPVSDNGGRFSPVKFPIGFPFANGNGGVGFPAAFSAAAAAAAASAAAVESGNESEGSGKIGLDKAKRGRRQFDSGEEERIDMTA